jgi:L-ascorbate metabolism protein UlaG (beta-lactamase superfamily)
LNDTTSDRTYKKKGILHRRQMAVTSFPGLFRNLVNDWNLDQDSDRAWLLYSANYLFRTAGVRWAMDPLMLHKRVPETPAVDLHQVFDKLEFVVLTHAHADHLDFDLIKVLKNLPLRWIIPEFMIGRVQAATGLSESQITTPRPLELIEICGISLLPIEGHHFEEALPGGGLPRGVPSMAYLVEFNGKNWFFPGDTRNYRPAFSLPPVPLEGMFAHLWLGKGCALMDEPLLLGEFCQFCARLNSKRVILTHLDEFGRDEDDAWGSRHVQMVCAHWEQLGLQIPIQAARMGERILL